MTAFVSIKSILPWNVTWARFLSLAQSKLKLCSANHRAGYFSNLACDWLSRVWAYSEQETENRPRSPGLNRFDTFHPPYWLFVLIFSLLHLQLTVPMVHKSCLELLVNAWIVRLAHTVRTAFNMCVWCAHPASLPANLAPWPLLIVISVCHFINLYQMIFKITNYTSHSFHFSRYSSYVARSWFASFAEEHMISLLQLQVLFRKSISQNKWISSNICHKPILSGSWLCHKASEAICFFF